MPKTITKIGSTLLTLLLIISSLCACSLSKQENNVSVGNASSDSEQNNIESTLVSEADHMYFTELKLSMERRMDDVAEFSIIMKGTENTVDMLSSNLILQKFDGNEWIDIKTFDKEWESDNVSYKGNVHIVENGTFRITAYLTAHHGSITETKILISESVDFDKAHVGYPWN